MLKRALAPFLPELARKNVKLVNCLKFGLELNAAVQHIGGSEEAFWRTSATAATLPQKDKE
jgi:hypothetical protein